MRSCRLSLALLLTVAGLDLEAAYGIKFKPNDTNAVASAYLVPENAFVLKMRQPDGTVRQFQRDFDQPNLLYGDSPWVGEDMGGGNFRILTNPEFKGGKTGFLFSNGRLRRLAVGRKNYSYDEMPLAFAAETNSVESLWPAELTREKALEMYGTWANDKHRRLSLGYGNPNKAGCLLAEIALLAVFFFCLRRKAFKAVGVVCFAVAFYFMLKTESRGAMVALLAALAIAGGVSVRRWFSVKRILLMVLMAAAAVALVLASGLGSRFTAKLVDTRGGSDSLRVTLMTTAPRMMVDSPGGWGRGVSGIAYASWYQDVREFRFIRTLVNSHLTWLVELGWVGRFLYLAAIIGLVFLLFVVSWRGASPLALAQFVLLFSAGCFNSVMESPTLWAVPVAGLVVLASRGRGFLCRRTLVLSALVGVVISSAALAALGYVGTKDRSVPEICGSKDSVVVGNGHPSVWVVDDNVVLGGGLLGKELRLFYSQFPGMPAMGIVWSIENLPANAETVVVAGRRVGDFLAAFVKEPERFANLKSLLFVSVPVSADKLPDALLKDRRVKLLQGEQLLARLGESDARQDLVVAVRGSELYVPGWMKYALDFCRDNNRNCDKEENRK